VLDVLVGGVTPNKQVVLVRATEGGEPVTGEFRIHNALEDLGAGARALRETIVVKQFIFPPELEVFAVRLGDGDLIVSRLEVHESKNLGVLGTVQEVFCEGEEIGILFDGFIEAAKICDKAGGAPRAILVLLGREVVVGGVLVGCGGGFGDDAGGEKLVAVFILDLPLGFAEAAGKLKNAIGVFEGDGSRSLRAAVAREVTAIASEDVLSADEHLAKAR
jgi:hypothetical protein